MQDIESHTIMYLRTLLDTRAIDDPEVATFLACWLYEETFHGIALARFVRAAGYDIELRPRSTRSVRQAIEARLTAWIASAWPDFVAVHMTWGAINELTTLTGYRRLAAIVDHPVLRDLLDRIVLDESRHFYFYYKQAERRLQRAGTARFARAVVERFWEPVGSGVQPASETRFLAHYLFGGRDGRTAARKVDTTIHGLPGFAGIPLLDAWIERTQTGSAARANDLSVIRALR
jgi:rubrerythrin